MTDGHLVQARRAGFTLIELLATMAIIIVFAGVIGFAFKGGDSSVGLTAAQRILISHVNLARGSAASLNTPVRLLICNDPNDPDGRYLRQVGLVVRHSEQPEMWRALDSGTRLPQGIYLVPEVSAITPPELFEGSASDWVHSRSIYGERTMNLEFGYPSLDEGAGSVVNGIGSWIFVEFSPDGRPTTQDHRRFLFARGGRNADGSLTLRDPRNIRGVIVRRYGTVTPINDYRDLGVTEEPEEP